MLLEKLTIFSHSAWYWHCFHCFVEYSFYAYLLGIFLLSWSVCWILWNAFLASVEIILRFLFPICWCDAWRFLFAYVEPTFHARDKSQLVWLNDLSFILLDSVGQYFVDDFCVCVHQGYRLIVLINPRTRQRCDVSIIKSLEKLPPFLLLWMACGKLG